MTRHDRPGARPRTVVGHLYWIEWHTSSPSALARTGTGTRLHYEQMIG